MQKVADKAIGAECEVVLIQTLQQLPPETVQMHVKSTRIKRMCLVNALLTRVVVASGVYRSRTGQTGEAHVANLPVHLFHPMCTLSAIFKHLLRS
jgi:hypothetical protein